MKTLLFALLFIGCLAGDFIRFPYPGLPSHDLDGKKEYTIFRRKQQAYLLINMLRVDPQGFVEKYMKPIIADDSWKLLFKTESVKLKKFPDYYPLYQDTLLEQTATHARLGESFASVRSRLATKLPKRISGFVPGFKPLKLLAQTLMWKTKTQNDFFSYLCHGHYQDFQHSDKKDLVLSGCKPDYINRKTPRGRIRFLLRPSGAVGCNNVNTMIKDDNMFACDVTYPDFSPRLRIKSPMVAGNWFNTGVGETRIYAVVIHVPRHEKVSKVELVIDGKMIEMPLTLSNSVSQVYSVSYSPLKHVPSLMKGYFFHAVINGKNFFYPAQFYYDWEGGMKLDEKQRYNGYCKVPFPDRTCDICDEGYRNVKGECVKCTADNCAECNADVCTKCIKGHLLSRGECKEKCIENCDVCTSASYCEQCKPTHYLDTVNGTCVECSKKFTDCATCTQDKCLTYFCQHQDPECEKKYTPGQYFSEITQKCEKCSEGCKTCNYDQFKGSKCTLCNDGLFLTSEGECIPCHYVDGCAPGQCDGIKCLDCKKGYYPSGKGCKRCDSNCEQCVANGTCISCAHGYTLDKEFGKCIESWDDENCLDKDATGVCTKCKVGFGFNKYHKCVRCDLSCKECTYAGSCDVCKDTFYNSNGKCIPCSTRACDLCDAKECFSCQPNAFLHNGVCIRGPPGCSLCHQRAAVCKVCEKGMKMVNGQCVPDCNIENCSRCTGDGQCLYCKTVNDPYGGYEPAPNSTNPCPFVCDPIKMNCHMTEKMKKGEVDPCFSLGCKECPEHTFRKDFNCVNCGNGCDKCLDEDHCYKCLPGYVLYNGKCTKCNKEGSCGEGEYKDGCECKECNKKFPHCVACDKDECIECEERYLLSEDKKKCNPCTKKTCTDYKVCNVTEPFSRVGDQFIFDPACDEKDNDCYCTKCKCNYHLDPVKHICVEVPQDNKLEGSCEIEDGCPKSCMTGYDLVDCQCIKTCRCGKLENGKCIEDGIKDIEYCKKISCSGTCEECLEGFYLNEERKCVPCPDKCEHCTSADTCNKCKPGYYLNVTTQLCDTCQNCTGVCDPTGKICLSCGKGQYLNETTGMCENCVNCEQCIARNDVVYCYLCEDGTIPVDGQCSRTVSFARSGAHGISVVVAIAMIIVMLL